jgi:hypothetical protein
MYVGTFSKILAAGIRLGWVVASPEIIRHLSGLKEDGGTSPFSSHIAAEFAASGTLLEHVGHGELDALGLESGELAPATGATIRDLEGLLGVFRSARDGADFGEWETAEALSDELGGFPIAARIEETTCGALEGTRSFLPTPERAVFMVPLSSDAVLVGSADGKLFRVEVEAFEEIAVPAGATLRSAARDASGGLWLTSTDGGETTLWAGTLAGNELALDARATTTSTIMRLAVSRSEPIELVGIDRSGGMHAYDGDRLRLVRPSDDPTKDSKVADLAVIEPGHVVGIHTDFAQLLRYRDGAASMEPTPLQDQPRGIEVVAELGVVVTMFSEVIYALDGGDWTQLGSSSTGLPPTDVVPIPTGFLIGSDIGAVEEYAFGSGLCRDEVLASLGEPTVIGAPLGDGELFATAYTRSSGSLAVVFVRRRFSM